MFRLAELFVQISGNDAPLNRTLAATHSKLLGMGGAGAAAGSALANGLASGLGLALPALGLGAAGVGTLGLAMGKGAKDASNFEDKLNLMNRVIGGSTAESMARLKADLREMATDASLAGVSLEQLADAAIMGGRMGIKPEGMKDFVRTAAEVSIALDDIPVEAAVQGITQVLGSFGRGVDEARNFAGALDALSNNSKTTGGEILDVANRLKSGAANLGMSPQDLLALSTAMKDVGLGTEMAGTNMGAILDKMASDTKGFAKVAGMSLKEFEHLVDTGPTEALKAFVSGLEGGRAGVEMLAELGITGTRAKTIVLSLGQSMERLTEFQAMSNEEWETMAYLNRDVATATQSSSAQMTRAWNEVSDVLMDLGEMVLPYVVRGFDGLAATLRMARTLATNWNLVVETAVLKIRQWGLNVGEAANWAMDNLGTFASWLGQNWLNLIVDAANGAWTIFNNLGTNIQNLWSAVMEFLASGTWSFDYTPMLDGFRAATAELPNIARPVFTSMEAEIAALWSAALAEPIAEAQEAAEAAEQAAEEARAARGGAAGEGGGSTDLAGFARGLQESALAGGMAARQVDIAQKHLTAFEQFKEQAKQAQERLQRQMERQMARMGAI